MFSFRGVFSYVRFYENCAKFLFIIKVHIVEKYSDKDYF